ncbi:MAG: hypothetical protein HYV63_01570 [Candidatus Schekmanbacteria bacterium]|nr:hypothetical protein [Candidatus Schekmanbacteria bacterium]
MITRAITAAGHYYHRIGEEPVSPEPIRGIAPLTAAGVELIREDAALPQQREQLGLLTAVGRPHGAAANAAAQRHAVDVSALAARSSRPTPVAGSRLEKESSGSTPASGEPARAPESAGEPQSVSGNCATTNPGQSVNGPVGRVFNRILGAGSRGAKTANQTFGLAELRRYLDRDLRFAEGEWFRGKKLDGAAAALLKELDKNGDGRVTWNEFQTFELRILQTLAPGVGKTSSVEQVRAAARRQFDRIDAANRDGRLSFKELRDSAHRQLPTKVAHRELVAQLAARLALDAVDTDQRGASVANRTLSWSEWYAAVTQIAKRRSLHAPSSI